MPDRSAVARPARLADAPAIVEMVRQGFDAALLEAFIYGCDGIERYVGEMIAARDLGADTAFFVGDVGDTAGGMIEMRALRDGLFLNYVAVLPACRKARVGSTLLEYATAALALPRHTTMSLDVLESNAAAGGWYERLGFRETARTTWYAGPVPAASGGTDRGLISGLPQAAIDHQAFGFSSVTVTTPERTYSVGRLGKRWFRVTVAEALEDQSLLAALRRLDGGREVLALLPAGVAPAGLRALTTTRRLTVPLDALREQLQRDSEQR